MATPHISAAPGEFAEAVLLPGDPRRARYIAESFLDDARQVTAVRNMEGFTGSYRGMPVSVMGTGMGIPSAAIYITELITEYGARRLVRVGSCGGIAPGLEMLDLILASGAATDSATNRIRYEGFDFPAVADFGLLRAAADAAAGVRYHVGVVHSSDFFYMPDDRIRDVAARMGVLAFEMEAAGLYGIAAERGARALAILTVSDLIDADLALTSDERERSLDAMVGVALDALVRDAS